MQSQSFSATEASSPLLPGSVVCEHAGGDRWKVEVWLSPAARAPTRGTRVRFTG